MLFDRFNDAADVADRSPGSMAAGATAGSNVNTVVAYPYTGDYRVNVLLDSYPASDLSVTSRWNYPSPLGTPIGGITYSFMAAAPSYGGNDGNNGGIPNTFGFSAFTPEQTQVTRAIFAHLTAELGINIEEVSEMTGRIGQIRLGQNNQDQAGTAGYTFLPNSADDGVAGFGLSGDVWIDYTYNRNYLLTPGGIGLETLVHEIGHALGLKHPGNYNAGGGVTATEPGNYLGAAEDNTNYTVMSYTEQPTFRDWYGMYDLLALKALYGADSSFNAGPTTYSYADADGSRLSIIDDASGSDTVNLSALKLGATIDLRRGAFSSIGRDKSNLPAVNNLSIDLLTDIENVTGTNYADHIILGAGTASANGNSGIDTVQYMQGRAAYTVTSAGLGSSLHVTAGGGVDDSLTAVERLQFADGKFAFDFNGNAGNALKVMGAALGQGAAPDPSTVGLGLAYLDGGTSYADLMQGAINYKLGASHTHTDFVNLVFANVAGVAPSGDQLAYWVGELDAGHYTEANLAVLAADTSYNLARVDFTGQSSHGLAYT